MSLLSEFLSGERSTYAPQSATIQGILADMYTTFASNVEKATSTEAQQNKDYENLMATLQQDAIDMKEQKSRKEGEKASAESDLADATANYDDTQEEMKANIKFFDETKEACSAKHKEWSVRSDLRDEELKGVKEALEMLTSDAARDLFATAIKPGVEAAASFLQIDEAHAQAVYGNAYKILKDQAAKAHSLRLAMLAVQVRSTKAGHFDKVIEAIDMMVNTLNEEGEADRAKRNQCKEEYQTNALNVQDLDWKIKNNQAKINKLQGLIEQRQQERQETIDQIDETKDYIKKITDERQEEHEAFLQAKKDDEAAIKLLNAAKDAFTAYYKKNKVDMGPIQGLRLMQKDPAFEVSADQAPEADFNSKGSSKVQSKGVVSLMDYIIQDLEDEVTNEKKNEAKSQADFESELASAEDLKKKLEDKQTSLEDTIAKRKDEKNDEEQDMKGNNENRDEELAYKAKITPDCDWIMQNFEKRAAARTSEMNGLTTAKEFLAGKSALLQVNGKKPAAAVPSKDKLANINFLGLRQ